MPVRVNKNPSSTTASPLSPSLHLLYHHLVVDPHSKVLAILYIKTKKSILSKTIVVHCGLLDII